MAEQANDARGRLLRRLVWALGGIYVLYLLAGLFLVPGLAREPLTRTLSELTGRDVQVGEIAFNPLGLSLEVHDLVVPGDDGAAMIEVPRFYADFELSSLLRWSLYLDVVEVEAPSVVLERNASGYNLAALGPAGDDGTPESPGPERQTPVFPLSIGELSLEDGHFLYRDETRAEPLRIELAPLGLRLEDFTTRGADEDDNAFQVQVTTPQGGSLSWSGRFELFPFSCSGELAMEDVALAPFSPLIPEGLALKASGGRLDLDTRYRLATGDKGGLVLSSGRLKLASLSLGTAQRQEPGLAWQSLILDGVSLDTTARSLEIDELALRQPELTLRRLPTGLEVAGFRSTQEAEKADSQPSEASASEEWRLGLSTLSVEQGLLRLRDETLREPGELVVTPVNLEVSDLSTAGDAAFRLRGETGLAGGDGRLQLSAQGTLEPLATVVDVRGGELALAPLQPWLSEYTRLAIEQGGIAPNLSLALMNTEGEVVPRLSGGGTVSDLTLSQTGGDNRLSLGKLSLSGLLLDPEERTLRLDQITLDAADIEAVVDEQGRGMVSRILVERRNDDDGKDRATEEQAGEPWQLGLGQLAVTSSRLSFEDRSVSPVYRVGLEEVSGGVSDVDTAAGTAGELRLKAKVDRYAPLSVSGSINARPGRNLTRVKVSLQGYEMTGLTPYTSRFLGYKVQSGQLALDSDASLRGSVLESRSRLRADNFYLGESVASEEAVKAPLKVGLAVLRDRDGTVTLPVNISGDLGDPAVSVRGLILKTIGNVLVKAATSPFSVLAGLVGTSEQLDHVPFSAGVAVEDENTLRRLEALATALAQRPRLQLKLTGMAVLPQDRQALAVRRLARRQANELGMQWQDLEAALDQESFRQAVLQDWRLGTGAGPESAPAGADVRAQARAALHELAQRSDEVISREALTALAAQRAQRTKSLLVDAHGVDAGRLFLQDPLVAEEGEPGVRLSLEAP